MRKGQREFYVDAKKAASEGKILLANAPTGIGKTAAVLSAILESALPAGRKVLFLTNRSSHHAQVIEEIKSMNALRKDELARLRPEMPLVRAVDKIAKEKMCLHRLRNPHETGALRCELSRAFCSYSKISQQAVSGLLESEMAAHDSNSFCGEFHSCPHFSALAAMQRADVIIADYRYLFDGGVLEVFLKSSGAALAGLDVIIDEAHNLPDAVREINSPAIDSESCSLALHGLAIARKLARKMNDAALAESFSAPYAYLKETLSGKIERIALSGEEDEDVKLDGKHLAVFSEGNYAKSMLASESNGLAGELLRAACFMRETFAKGGMDEEFSSEAVRSLEGLACFLLSAAKAAAGDKKFGLFSRNEGEGKFTVKAALFDSSDVSSSIFDEIHSAILMSGTLVGKRAIVDLLGIEEGRVIGIEESAYESAFSPELHPIAICTAASSRFSERADGTSMRMMGRIISEAARACLPYSVAVFYPSYNYMGMMKKELDMPGFFHEHETRKSSGGARERKARLESNAAKGAIAFHAVIGGSFSEGVDFKKNPFKLIIIAGFPHPKSGGAHSSYEEYIAWKFKSRATASMYASIYPAIIRSVQALGRGVRSESDWCYGLLLDDRFEQYKLLLPEGIRTRARLLAPSAVSKDVERFVKERQK